MLPQSPQAYQIPLQDSSDPTLFEIENISKFSNRYAQILSADSPNQLAEAFENKIREHINYQNEKFKELILIGLDIIDKKLFDPNVKIDEKVAICSKLQERVGLCPQGFVAGLQMINLQIPQSTIIDVLYQMRYDIVNSTALQHLKDSDRGNEIHFVNAYFKTANEHGLGVLWEKADDYSSVKPKYFVHLQQSFNEKYQFEAIWKTLMDKIEEGYKNNSEGYKNNSREEWIARLKVLMPQLQEVDDHYQKELHRIAIQKELAKQPLENLADIDEVNLNLVVSTTQDALQKQSEKYPNNQQIQKALAFHKKHEKEIENYFSTVKSLDEEQKSLRCIEDWVLDEEQKLNQSHLENFLWEALSAQGIFKCDQLEDFLDNSLKNFLPKPLETALISKIQASDAQNAEIFLTLARIYHHFQGNDHVRAAIFDKIHSEQSITIALSQLVEMKAAIENFPQKMKLGHENKTAVLSCLDDTYRYCDYPEWVALQLDILFQQCLEHLFYILFNFTYFQTLIFLDLTDLDKDNPFFLYIFLVLSTIFLPVLTAFSLILEIILHLHILISVSRILLYPLMASQLTIQRTDVVKESFVTPFLKSFIDIKNNDQNREPLPLWAKKWLIAQSIVRLEDIKGLSDEEKLQLRS